MALLLEFDIKTSNFYSARRKPRALGLKTSNFYVLKLKTAKASLENHTTRLHYCWNLILKRQISITPVEKHTHTLCLKTSNFYSASRKPRALGLKTSNFNVLTAKAPHHYAALLLEFDIKTTNF